METRLDGNKNEINDDLHSSDICTSSCSDVENQKDDGFHGNKQSHDISGCEIEAIKESEARKQRAKFEADLLAKKTESQEKLNHGNFLSDFSKNFIQSKSNVLCSWWSTKISWIFFEPENFLQIGDANIRPV